VGDRERRVVGGQDVEHEARDPAAGRVRLELAHQAAAEAVALQLVGDGEGDVGDLVVLGAAHVARGADDLAVALGDHAYMAVAVDVRERLEHRARQVGRHAGEEALVAGVGRQGREELGQARAVLARLGSEHDRGAVVEGDGEHRPSVRDRRSPVSRGKPYGRP
jgi:hypothetical protein